MELTLSIKGTPQEMLAVVQHLVSPTSGLAAAQPVATDSHLDVDLRAFLESATDRMREAIGFIALRSINEAGISRPDLQRETGAKDEQELNGWMGSIGRAWAKHIGAQNPFVGRQSSAGIVYRIDDALARRILDLLADVNGAQ